MAVTRPMTRFVYAPDPVIRGGGTDRRVARLAEAVGAEVVRLEPRAARSLPIAVGARFGAALRGIPPRLTQAWYPAIRRDLAAALDASDLVVATTTFTAAWVPEARRSRTVLDAHNVESDVVRQLAETHPDRRRRAMYRATQAWTASFEQRLARTCAAVWAVSEREAQWFSAAGARTVVVVPNGVDLPEDLAPLTTDPVLLFVGSLGSLFNRQGLAWFIDHCWDRVRAAVPNVRLQVIGTGGIDRSAEGVEVLGFVDDLGASYGQARVSIVPLQAGAGTRLKVLEAFSFGRPVVSTSIGSDGIDVQDGVHLLLADEAAGFADACIAVLEDDALASRLGTAARDLVVSRYAWRDIGAIASASLERLGG